MSYYDQALVLLNYRDDWQQMAEFNRLYASGKEKIMASDYLIRLMSKEESICWNEVAPIGAAFQPERIANLFGAGGDLFKWFAFDRPYLFSRQTVNVVGGREGQGFVMVIPLKHEMKNTLIKKLLPASGLGGLPREMVVNSCRCKKEGSTITLGIPKSILEKMSINMSIERIGARITPR